MNSSKTFTILALGLIIGIMILNVPSSKKKTREEELWQAARAAANEESAKREELQNFLNEIKEKQQIEKPMSLAFPGCEEAEAGREKWEEVVYYLNSGKDAGERLEKLGLNPNYNPAVVESKNYKTFLRYKNELYSLTLKACEAARALETERIRKGTKTP